MSKVLNGRRVLTLSAVTFTILAVLSSSCSFVEAKGSIDNEFFQLLPLSAAQPTTINVLLAFIVIGIVLVALGFLHALRRHWKKIAVALLVVVAVIAGFYAVWSFEASISYWLVAPDTTATEDNYLTMYCENTGRLTGTFDLELAFTNAHFSQKPVCLTILLITEP